MNSQPPEGYFDSLEGLAFSPGWAKREPAMWASPRPKFVPAVWRYTDALTALMQSSSFVSTEFAERRNLIMVSPVEGNAYPTCRHLVAAYQLVLPGETARSHRHSPNALRFVLDARPGMYTLVNGVKIDMADNDVVLTPQWHWHGHANYSDAPAFWIDFLDVPLVQNLENMFFEHHADSLEVVRESDPDSPFRFRGAELLRRVIEERHIKLAADPLPTIALHVVKLNEGENRARAAGIENSLFAVMDGSLTVSAQMLGKPRLTRGDVVCVPSWYDYTFEAGPEGATLLRVTDSPVFNALGFVNVANGRAAS